MRKLHNMASFDNMSDDNNCNNNNNNNNCKILGYRIYKCSSYSPTYVPENILVDKPLDQSSRWSSENDNHPQYIVLKLDQASIVKSITFGKFEKTHVCNMKKFKIYGAIEYDKWTELLNAGLKNDTVSETFELKHTIGCDNVYYPIRYIKIMPLESWGPSFNYSIWFVCLNGIDDKSYINYNINRVNQYLNNEIIRLCMKHFRRLKQTDIVDSLVKNTSSSSSSSFSFEDKHLSLLYDILVNNGDYKQAEIFITNSINNGLLDEYISNQPYKAIWNKINCDEPKPGKRGGHQMVLDSNNEILYLFGGWDGRQDLADLWSYDIKLNKWTLICNNTELVGGPNARSCHKMTFDQDRKQLFTIGKYLDTQYRNVDNLKCDFYVYDIEKNQWTLISNDTYSVGGPPLIFDHQMCIDHDKRMIYVFGGRILLSSSSSTTTNTNTSSSPPPPPSVNAAAAAAASCNVPSPSSSTTSSTTTTEPLFSGLYSYHIPTSTWKLLASDTTNTNSSSNINCSLRARVGHSMLFNQIDRKLYISPGQRCKEYLNDYFTYNVDTNDIQRIYLADFSINNSNNNNNDSLNKNERFSKDEFNKNISPGAGYTQRATIDPVLGEIYVLSGPGKDKDKREENVQNSFWVYNIKNSNWTCIYRNENIGEKYWSKMQDIEPCPRFAHQLVYDKYKKIHYLFGGNPGRTSLPKLRLDDFWTLKLCRPTHDELLKNFKWIIRKYKFEEIAINGNSIEALEYLQNDVYEIIDHNDPIQTKEFQLLTSVLFKSSSSNSRTSTDDADDVDVDQVHNKRVQLYDKISEFFPESMTQPRANLTDLLL